MVSKVIKLIQNILRGIWDERNKQLHDKEQSLRNKEQHDALDLRTQDIFWWKNLISNRCMSHTTASYFKTTPARVKRMKLRRKTAWVNDTEEMLDALENLSEEALLLWTKFYTIYLDNKSKTVVEWVEDDSDQVLL